MLHNSYHPILQDFLVDVGSVVEAISAEDGDAPLYKPLSVHTTHCGERNNEVQFAGEIQPRGCCYWLEVPSGDQKLFHRQVVKSESVTIKIPELDFEIPPEAQRGSDSPFTLILDDPAGNGFIENLYAPSPDPSLSIEFYEQQALLGYLVDPSQSIEESISASDQMKRKPHGSVGAAAGHRAIALSNSAEIADALF
ncbi:hypothetical protein Q3G72_009380 [Acer saccharum]|nr:hypothetical protein Q3G72_009380 [Acer saccharum]